MCQEGLVNNQGGGASGNMEKIHQEELKKWLNIEDSIVKQKAKTKWLSYNDENTKFFHAAVKDRMAKSRISKIQNDNGEIKTDEEGIGLRLGSFILIFRVPKPLILRGLMWKRPFIEHN